MRVGVDLTACWRPRAGMGTCALELTRALLRAADGEVFTLFCSRERPPGLDAPATTTAVLSPHRHEVANKLAWLASVEAAAGLDVMLYPYWPPPPVRRRGAPPAVTLVHDVAFRARPAEVPWQQRLYLGRLLPAAVRRSATVLVPSAATRDDVLRWFPAPGLERRLHVIPEGSGVAGVAPGSLPAGVEPGFMLAVGTVEPRKNYLRLLAAHRRLRARRAVPPLVVVGRVGWAYGSALDELREDPGVRLLSDVDDPTLAALYRGAGLLAFPSLYEGFGLPLLEAMEAGLPALVGRGGSLPELAGGAALEVDPLSAEAIAEGLQRLLDDPELRSTLAERGRARATEFTWDGAGRRVLEILHQARG
ncbi:MAG: glycosyltransferase family 4 protein [bacterium]|nr:glycosyltransferase family 4 protein [bacterium]